ncbi:unnamed protein product, partial [Ectocarpus sp. 13 AM-2016]
REFVDGWCSRTGRGWFRRRKWQHHGAHGPTLHDAARWDPVRRLHPPTCHQQPLAGEPAGAGHLSSWAAETFVDRGHRPLPRPSPPCEKNRGRRTSE